MKPLYKVLVTGSRDYDDEAAILVELVAIKQAHPDREILVIQGGAEGADKLSEAGAKSLNMHTARVDALWRMRHGGAGPQRNSVMVALEPDEALAFHPDLEHSKGTADCVKQIEKAGIPYKVIS